jgi:hypothetical protein
MLDPARVGLFDGRMGGDVLLCLPKLTPVVAACLLLYRVPTEYHRSKVMHLVSRPSIRRIALLLFVVVPAAAWVIVKPVRVVAPTLVGVTCLSASVCVDDPSAFGTAEQLHSEARAFLAAEIAPLAGAPRVIFCASSACADAFGLGARSAVTIGTIGTVIGPKAWKPHYVRHELIHQLQGQRLGVIALLFKPSWFVEGMAYSLSQDPRQPLNEPWEDHRRRFASWFQVVGKGNFWREAGKL